MSETKMSAELEKQALSFFDPKMITSFLPALLPFLPMILIAMGAKIKSKDVNDTGADDVLANIFISLAPVIGNINAKDQTGVKAALRAVRDTIDNYLSNG